MGDTPDETQETESQPINANMKAQVVPALEDFNSRLEVPLMPEGLRQLSP